MLQDGQYKIQGEPTEAALKVFAEKLAYSSGIDGKLNFKTNATPFSDVTSEKINKVATLDFSSERKCMSTVITNYKQFKNNVVLLKGAPERVIEKCSSILNDKHEKISITDAEKTKLLTKINQVAS